MTTLRELIDKHRDQVPGLKVRQVNGDPGDVYKITACNDNYCLWRRNDGYESADCLEQRHWELYQPPAPTKVKRRVMMYPVVITKEQFKREYATDSDDAVLLTDRGVEVEVDDD